MQRHLTCSRLLHREFHTSLKGVRGADIQMEDTLGYWQRELTTSEERHPHLTASRETSIMYGRGQSFATTHGTAPMCFGSMHPEPLLTYGLARAVVTSESSIVTLCMADGIIINLFGTLHILWLLGLLPELYGQHIRIHYRTGLCPGIEPLKPVVVLHILRHTILNIDREALLCFIHPSALASQLGIA